MTEDTNQITADNLRADFLNATTNWERWKVLNRALNWAVAASENADAAREQAAALKARAERSPVKAVGCNPEMLVAGGVAAEIKSRNESLQLGDAVYWGGFYGGEDDIWVVVEVDAYGAVEIAKTPGEHPMHTYRVHPAELTKVTA